MGARRFKQKEAKLQNQGGQRTSQSRYCIHKIHIHLVIQVRKLASVLRIHYRAKIGKVQLPRIGFYIYLQVTSFNELKGFARLFKETLNIY